MKLILASRSPRRKMLLQKLGLRFDVIPSDVDESQVLDRDPARLVTRLAELKAETVARNVVAKGLLDGALVIGADSMVSLNGEVIGKPRDEEDARRILRFLSGRAHNVFTGFCVINTDTDERVCDFEKSEVTVKNLTDEDISRCLENKVIMDGAGSYTPEIHGLIFENVEGSYSNVIGLPTERLIPILRKHGISV